MRHCAAKPFDLYRMLAAELGLRPGPRAHIVADITRAFVSLVDDRGIVPILTLDDAQDLRDDLLHELHGLTSIDFDGRDYLTLWLVGHPLLARRLPLHAHPRQPLVHDITIPAADADGPTWATWVRVSTKRSEQSSVHTS